MLALRRVATRPLRPQARWLSQSAPCLSKQPITPKRKLPVENQDALYSLEAKDFRPPWVYTGVKLVNYLVIPAVFLYSMFIFDWGEGDHVFQPPRRWLKRQQEAFFALSPEDEKLAHESAEENKPSAISSS